MVIARSLRRYSNYVFRLKYYFLRRKPFCCGDQGKTHHFRILFFIISFISFVARLADSTVRFIIPFCCVIFYELFLFMSFSCYVELRTVNVQHIKMILLLTFLGKVI